MTRNTIHFVERFKPSIILFTLLCCLFLAGCAEDKEQVEAIEEVDQSEQAIRAVIEKVFSGPDKKYIELWDSLVETDTSESDMSQEEYDATLERPEYQALIQYMKDTYALHFTDNAYENFVSQGSAFRYSHFYGDYKLSASDIEIVQSKNGENLYNFTFVVHLTDSEGEISPFNIKGKAIAPEDGKIGKIDFKDVGFKLIQAIEAIE